MRALIVLIFLNYSQMIFATVSEEVKEFASLNRAFYQEHKCGDFFERGITRSCREILSEKSICDKKPVKGKPTSRPILWQEAHASMLDWLTAEFPEMNQKDPPETYTTMAMALGKTKEFSEERERRFQNLLSKKRTEIQNLWSHLRPVLKQTVDKHGSLSSLEKKKSMRFINEAKLVLDVNDLSSVTQNDREYIKGIYYLSCGLDGRTENAVVLTEGTQAYILICRGLIEKIGSNEDPSKHLAFVLAHEAGHIISKVSENSHDPFAKCLSKSELNKDLKRHHETNWFTDLFYNRFKNHREEFMADYWGYQVMGEFISMANAAGGTSKENESFLTENLKILCGGDGSDGVHPEFLKRISVSHTADLLRLSLPCKGDAAHECRLP